MSKTAKPLPLVVDLDGTLIRSDMLLESFFATLTAAPLRAIQSLQHLGNRALFKATLAENIAVDITTLPYNEELLVWLKEQKAAGRKLYLASAAHESYVKAIANHLGIFDGFLASDHTTNLKSEAKAEKLCIKFGAQQFDYVGNEQADIPVWEKAATPIITNASASFAKKIKQRFPAMVTIATAQATQKDYFKALRPHQWLKNLLIFVPLLVGHQFEIESFVSCFIAFLSFSLCASSGYLLNDLLDLQHDRAHHSKRHRPLAAGRLSLHTAIALIIETLVVALFLALFQPPAFMLILLSYYFLSLLYSTVLKRYMMLDVIVLSLLYGMRIVAGGMALSIALSPWLLSFSTFFFLSLALIKRCSELAARTKLGTGDPVGRDYRLTDLPLLESMAAAAGYVAALTSGLYISGDKVIELYSNPERLWAIPIILLFWFSRMLMLTHRGAMDDDPVLFAARDEVSQICGIAIFCILIVSI